MTVSQLRVLVLGGGLTMQGAVLSDLNYYHVEVTQDPMTDLSKLSAAILIHPEAADLVASYRTSVPVVVISPENTDVVERYLLDGVEEVISTLSAFSPGAVFQAVRRALARRSSVAKLERAARIDPLTELLNRRGLAEALHRVASREQGTAALLIDIDDFKAVNTARGMAGGDALLRAVGGVLLNHARPTDLVGRLGGDEFMVILPGVGFQASAAVAERLRVAIQTTGVTASIGLSMVNSRMGVTLDDVVSSTQDALSSSKVLGKNCVAVDSAA